MFKITPTRHWDKLERKNVELEAMVESQNWEIEKLKELLEKKKHPPLLDYPMEDPSPASREERMQYTARVVGFYHDILRKKLYHLISEQQQLLSNPTLTRDQDTYHKATINAYALLLDWGDDMEAEYLQAVREQQDDAN